MGKWKFLIAAGLGFTSHAAATVLWSPQTAEMTAKLTRAEYLPGSGFTIAIEAPPGSYGLEFSENLGPPPWQNLAQLSPANGEAAYLDTAAVSRGRGFYRVGGSFTSGNYHSITPGFAVESGFGSATNGGPRGDLLCEVSTADMLLEHQGEVSGLMRSQNTEVIDCYIAPQIADLSAFKRTGLQATAPFSFNPGGWQSHVPAGLYPLREGEAFAAATAFPFQEMETDRASLVAVGLRTYQGALDPESDEPQPFSGNKLELPFLIQKSTDAEAEDTTGAWGMISLAVRGELTAQGGELPPTLPGHVHYAVSAAVAEISATSNAEATLSISRESIFQVRQSFNPSDAVDIVSGESSEARSFEMQLESNGAVSLRDIQESDPAILLGAISPTAGLFVVAGSTPPADVEAGNSAPGNVPIDPGATTGAAITLAVRREVNPQLANRSYRAIWIGFYITPGGFEISRWNPEAQVTINAGATAATISATQRFYSTTFDGFTQSESFSPGAIHELAVAPDGMISLTEDAPNSAESRYAGFAQLGANLIILSGTRTELNGSAEVSIMILMASP
ncbi:MAG: hypothetical protein ACRCXD_00150 [Luteolibacter sp.]